ncbi:hypothetical protein DI09_16p220 [Mitosporidium daphniae]|uniref:Uncharacterized protein n=1 Tax=Mitosporidium daphniae TaxID=1485682 RepID=A0A098VTP7_9MICR|nr:uncharacterized protein DI09_16p220 [Mitosporidium daphniae]KGG52468.1 hypothetical protein DI09_16p220 [Mitosporidium daphniae]|eukprot:XP_013238895.1 uncharacterized protein DI09_16p220 [Mitosporidium daphniae]
MQLHAHESGVLPLEKLLRVQLQEAASPRNIFIALMAMLATLNGHEAAEQKTATFLLASKLVSQERNAIGVALLKSASASLIECLWDGLTLISSTRSLKISALHCKSDAKQPPVMAAASKENNATAIAALGYLLSIVAPSKFYLFFQRALPVDQQLLLSVVECAFEHIEAGPSKDKLITALLKIGNKLPSQLIRILVKGYATLASCSHILFNPENSCHKEEESEQMKTQSVVGALISSAVFTDRNSTDFFMASVVPFSQTVPVHRRIQLLSLLQTLRVCTEALACWLAQAMNNDSSVLTVQVLMRSIFIDRGSCDPIPLLAKLATALGEVASSERKDLLRVIGLLVRNFLSETQCIGLSQRIMSEIEGSMMAPTVCSACPTSWDILAVLAPRSSDALQFLLKHAVAHSVSSEKAPLRALENFITQCNDDDNSHHIQVARILTAAAPSKLTYRMLEKILTPALTESEPKILAMVVLGLKERSSFVRTCATRMVRTLALATAAHPEVMVRLLGRIAAGVATSTHPLARAASLKALALTVGCMVSTEHSAPFDEHSQASSGSLEASSPFAYLKELPRLIDYIRPEARTEVEDATLVLVAIFKKIPSRKLVERIFTLAPTPLLRSFVSLLIVKGMEDLVPENQRRIVTAVRKARSRLRRKAQSHRLPKIGGSSSPVQSRDQQEYSQDEDELNYDIHGRLVLPEDQFIDHLNPCHPAVEEKEIDSIEQPERHSAAAPERRRKRLIPSQKVLKSYSFIPLSRKLLGTHREQFIASITITIKVRNQNRGVHY